MKIHEFASIEPNSRDFQRSFIENHLKIDGDMLTLKILADSLRLFSESNTVDLPTTLNDLVYQIEVEYQEINNLDPDNWGMTEADEEELGIE